MKQKMIDFLLANANPSIKLRVKKEILQDITEQEENEWQAQILDERIIKLMTEKQQPSGWIGLGYHGPCKDAGQYDNQETGTKYLGEKGMKGSIILDRAMDAFSTTEISESFLRRSPAYEEGSIDLTRAACIARAGYSNDINIEQEVAISLGAFKRVTEVDSIFDVSRPMKHFRVFNDNETWTCRYHLEILTFTTELWKNEENVEILAEAFKRLMRKDREEIINTPVKYWVGNHGVNPGWHIGEGYSIKEPNTDGIHRINVERVEWLSRCGLYSHIPELKEEVDYIMDNINNDGIYMGEVEEWGFRNWSPYFGQQLETDWRAKKRKQCDVTFRALLTAHYAGL